MTANNATTAAVYVRVSTARQEEEGTSLGSQEAACRAHCDAKGWKVSEGHVYREVYSGAELWDRPKLSAMRAASREKAVGVIVCYAIDRLSRDPVHLGVIVSEADHAGTAVEFVTEPLDDSPEGQLIRFVRGYAARVEREKARERTLRGKHSRIMSGKVHNYGHELYGYRRDKERGVRDLYEPEAAVVRRIFRWVVEGGSIKAVVRRLNGDGVPPPSAGKMVYKDGRTPRWGNGAVHRILREPAYKGEGIAWRRQSTGKNGGSIVRPEAEWVKMPEGTTPAVIAPETFAAVQTRMDAASVAAAATRNTARPYLLRGLMVCGVCGRAMRSCPEKDRRVYRCASRETPAGACGGRRVPAEAVEAWLWSEIEPILENPGIIAAEVARQREAGPEPTLAADREAADRLLTKLDRQQERNVRRLAEAGDDFPVDLLEREIARVEGERKSLRATLTDIDARVASREATVVRLDDLQAYCATVRANLKAVDFTGKREAVEALVERVIANGGDPIGWKMLGSIPCPPAGIPYSIS